MRVKLDNLGKKYEGRDKFTIRNIDLDIKDKAVSYTHLTLPTTF